MHDKLSISQIFHALCFLLVVKQFPFELTEKGWGEFEVIMKIYFVDPTEKPCIVHHFLRLYPLEDVFMIHHPIIPPHNRIITEQYEEIVFHDPSVMLNQVLKNTELEAISLKPYSEDSVYADAYKAEKQRLADTKKKLLAEIEKVRKRQLECEKKLRR